ncbi:hypothetical protein HYPSUDRAFT_210035 [Hypholoma sublateritium FD-334 SS-4]|uniref:Uncharacterized protein n=1 Tax=Hypholoma sublateritium (strain FD-334 SS-4) TaxID=945553 RepID=A0A0D2NWE3_HYPSF|nr:hypothetical protein HYPSUDRAFT_210035 [Hypholoma sublateritium FD-334 SS-4]
MPSPRPFPALGLLSGLRFLFVETWPEPLPASGSQTLLLDGALSRELIVLPRALGSTGRVKKSESTTSGLLDPPRATNRRSALPLEAPDMMVRMLPERRYSRRRRGKPARSGLNERRTVAEAYTRMLCSVIAYLRDDSERLLPQTGAVHPIINESIQI